MKWVSFDGSHIKKTLFTFVSCCSNTGGLSGTADSLGTYDPCCWNGTDGRYDGAVWVWVWVWVVVVVVVVVACYGHYCSTGGHCGDAAVVAWCCGRCYGIGGHCDGVCGLCYDTGGHLYAVFHWSSGSLSCTAVMMNDGAVGIAAAASCAAAD